MLTPHAPLDRELPRAPREPADFTVGAWQSDARETSPWRLVLAPLALLLAALAGVVYALLLPICGIASIAEATARTSWGIARDAFRRTRRRAAARA